jgi:hypothetical protein
MRLSLCALLVLLPLTRALGAAGLTAHLTLDGTLDDVTRNHDGTSLAAPAFDTGIAGDALQISTARAAVTLGNPQALDFGKDFTVSAWVKTTYAGEQVVIYRGHPARFVSPALQINVQGPKFFIYGDSQGSLGADFQTTDGLAANDGEWHQLAVSYSAATTPHFTLYLDGIGKHPGDAGTFFAGDFVTKPNLTNSVVRVGGRDAESDAYRFNGAIDDVQFYDRTLKADQVKFLFDNPGIPLPLPVVPVIVVQPLPLQTVAAGSTVSFSVVAEAQTGPGYQWQVGGVNIPNATSATLTLTNVTTVGAGDYTVVVSNAAGTVTSAVAKLVVGGGPELALSQYAGITINGTAGLKYRIDYEPAIGPGNAWQELTNLVLTANQALFIDLQSTNAPKRIYRAVLVP